jgi:hypothetical protein
MALIPSPDILSIDEMGRVAPPIIESVGPRGKNDPGDVFVIQSLLNDRLQPHPPIPVTGVETVETTLAIEYYQAAIMGMTAPTGSVEPGSETYYRLAARPLVNAPQPTGHFGVLPPPVIEAAVASNEHWRVPAAVTLAQWAIESAWGAAMPVDSNNPFGIKAVGSQPSVDTVTHEVINGATVEITAKFRKFDSLTQAFDEHGKLLATSPAYAPAMQQVQNPDAFADALTGVYATDPEYGMKLRWVMQNYKLTTYDK